MEELVLGHILDVVILILTAIMCYWSVYTYVCETRGNNTAAKAAAKKFERKQRFERWREEPTRDNLLACIIVKVDPRTYRAF